MMAVQTFFIPPLILRRAATKQVLIKKSFPLKELEERQNSSRSAFQKLFFYQLSNSRR